MATTRYKLAEQALREINKGNQGPNEDIQVQDLLIAVTQAFGSAVKSSYFINKADGVSEVSGTFIYSFKNQPVILDADLNVYYTELPSSYIDIPNESGIEYVGTMLSGSDVQSQSEPMVRVPNGFVQLSRNLAVENLQTRKGFYVEGNRIVYIRMTPEQAALNVLIKLAVSLEGIDEDTLINIPPDIQDQIITSVVQKYLVVKQLPEAKIGDKL